MRLLVGVRPARMCFDSSPLFGSVAVCLATEARASESCPCQGVRAVGVHLHRGLQHFDGGIMAPVAVAAAADYPKDRSALHLTAHPSAALGPAGVLTTMQIGLGQAGEPLGLEVAIVEMACLFLCSRRVGLGKCGSHLLCRRRYRRRAAVDAGYCIVT